MYVCIELFISKETFLKWANRVLMLSQPFNTHLWNEKANGAEQAEVVKINRRRPISCSE